MRRLTKKKLRIIEFILIGIVMGTVEDLIAVTAATDETLDAKVFLIVLAVAVPFAFVSEIVVDHPRFWEKMFRFRKEDKEEQGTTPPPSTTQDSQR